MVNLFEIPVYIIGILLKGIIFGIFLMIVERVKNLMGK